MSDYVMVPRKPTDAMIEAAFEGHYGKRRARRSGGAKGISMAVNGADFDGYIAFRRMWKAALAAAPDGDMITPPEPSVTGAGKAYAWASEWQGLVGKGHAFHDDKKEAHANAKWMAGRAFPLFEGPVSTPPEPVGVTREAVIAILDDILDAEPNGYILHVEKAADAIIALAKTEGKP